MIEDLRAAFPAMPDGVAALFAGLAAASRPVDDLTISEWADRYRVVSEESGSPWPGPFRTARVPYLREPQDCLHPDHPARRVTARWAAQLGKSTAIENWFGFIVDQAPGSMMIVLPTLDEATKFNRVKLQPTIDASPRIAHRVAPVSSRDEQGSTTAFKRFAGGFCQIVNAGSSKGLQMVSIKYLAMDEVTGYLADVDGRGSPRDQARARQKMYGDLAKEWQGSTPGIAGECAITEDFEAGDRRYFYVPCPHCAVRQALMPDMMRGPDEAKRLPAHLRCQSCDGVILDGHKGDLLASGEWIATRVRDGEDPVPATIRPDDMPLWRCPPCEGRCRDWQPSYHLWAAYAPREKLGVIWEKGQLAEGDATKMRTYCQQDLAEPYDPGGVAIEWQQLSEAVQASTYPRGVIPPGTALVVSAADVQGYGIKWVVYAIGPRGQRYLIDREVFDGAPDQTDDPWIALADAHGREYPTAGGRMKGIDLSGVDSGFATDRVYRFCSGRPNCFALDGRHNQGRPWLGTPVKRDIKDAHRRIVSKVMLYPVGLYDVKTEVVAGLSNLILGPDKIGTWPRNTLHLTSDLVDAEFAQELTAERLVDPDEPTGGNAKKKRLVSALIEFMGPADRRRYGIRTGSKLLLVTPTRLVPDTNEVEGLFSGVVHDANGRRVAYRLRQRESGLSVTRDHATRDKVGRQLLVHAFDPWDGSDVRGISPIAAAMRTHAHAEKLNDATLATAILQTVFAATLTSAEPSQDAFQAIEALDDDSSLKADFLGYYANALEQAKKSTIAFDGSRTAHLAPGEKLELMTAATPGSTYLPFSADLRREMARCLGITAESFTLDYSAATYSSTRMSTSSIWPVVMRRRERIAGPIAQALYESWLDEEIGEGRIPLRGGHAAFMANRDAICWAEWQGPAKPTADDGKSAKAASERLQNGTTTLEYECAELGLDSNDVIAKRAEEAAILSAKGLPSPFERIRGGGGQTVEEGEDLRPRRSDQVPA